MKAIKLTGIKEMDIFDVETPSIKNNSDVLIRIKSVGVCGSDVHYYKTGRIGSQVVEYPFSVGHECSGIIEEVGSEVTTLNPGDYVAVDPAMPCYECDQCKEGRFHTCRNLKFLGCPGQAEGCLSEFIVMPAKSCFRINKEKITLTQAALSEPLSIGYYACELSGLDLKGKNIAILGFGPIGISVMFSAKAFGAEVFFVTDKLDYRIDLAKKLGASFVVNPTNGDVEANVLQNIPQLVDIVFECCGQQDAVDNALEIVKPGGKIMLIGIPEVDDFSFKMDLMRRKEVNIQNVRRQNECVRPALNAIEKGLVNVDIMKTHKFPLEETKTAFELVSNYKDGVIKAMIEL